MDTGEVRQRMSEAEVERLLVERTRGGCSEALADLVRKHSPQIYGWSLKILKNHADAQDNTQNVLCKMYLNIDQFKGRSRFSTWLFRMTINEALIRIRMSRSRPVTCCLPQPNDEDGSSLDVRDGHADPERQYLAKELVGKAFLAIHPSLTQLFVKHAHGWTQRELADQMGVSVAALKARIFSARARMMARLNELC